MGIKELIKKIPTHISIIFTYILVLILIELMFYTLIPLLLNYPPDSINNQFQIDVAGVKYSTQYIILSSVIAIGATIALYFALRKIDNNTANNEDRKDIRRRCMEYPYKIYLFEMIIPSLTVLTGLLLIKTEIILAVRIMIIFLSLATILCVTSLIVSKRMYEKTLANTYDESIDLTPEGKRIGLTRSMVMQIFPIFLFSILITSLIGYSRVIDEKGDVLFNSHKSEFKETIKTLEEKTLEEAKGILSNNHDMFLIDEVGNKIAAEGNISQFFIMYLLQKSFEQDGRVYEYYGSNIQAVSEEIEIDGAKYFVGVRYAVTSNYTIIYFLISFVVLFIFNLIASWSISRNISYEIEKISERLNRIAEREDIEQTSKLPITTNNEISDLVGSFNKILDLEKENVETIKNSQTALVEQERLATLGQLAGGMAHDINTPLSSISTGISYFEETMDLNEDTKEIVNAMRRSVDKISVIVNSVRDQIRNMGMEKIEEFGLNSLIKNVEMLLFSELKKYNCKINFEEKDNVILKGDIGKLEQVVTNIVLNAVQAYEGKGGIIDIEVYREQNKAIIKIEDNAGGIPDKIAEGLFNQILTTKGSRGTGFGLYFSNSIVKGIFNGNLKFETEYGKGSIFYIELPINA